MTESFTAGTLLIEYLLANGIDTVFGIPGVHTLEMYRSLTRYCANGSETGRLRHIAPRHEQGAAFMADGYARVTGRPAACVLITGPGVLNAATAIGEAYSDSVPMVVLSSVAARADLGLGRGRLHEMPAQQAAIATVTGFSRTILHADAVPDLITQALAHTLPTGQTRPRPVHLDLPLDVAVEPVRQRSPLRPVALAPLASPPDQIAQAVALLSQARQPVLILGGGALGTGEAARQIAAATGALIIPTIAGKGIVSDHHPASLGATLPLEPTRKALAQADIVLAVGTELAETDHWVDFLDIPGQLIRVDLDPEVLVRDYPPALAIRADAGLTLAAIAASLPASDGTAAARAAAQAERIRRACRETYNPLRQRHAIVLDALREALPDNAVIAADMTMLAYAGNVHFPCDQERSWLHPVGFGTLGYALPAAIGAKLGAPDRPVIAIAGDYGTLFTIGDLATAVEWRLPIPILLWHNDGLGQIRQGMVQRDIPPLGVDLPAPDYQMLARSFGALAERPQSREAFMAAMQAALTADRPTLIEVNQADGWLEG